MGISPCKLGRPLLPHKETVGSPLLPNMKKMAAQWAVEWTVMGILPCKLGCPYFHIWKQWAAQWAAQYAAHCFQNMKMWAAEWAAHGNFAMQIRLSITSL